MWSLGRQLLVGSLAIWSASAELTFSAQSVQAGGEWRALSQTEFKPVPPRQRWRHNATHRQNATLRAEGRDIISHSGSWCGASQHSTASDKIVNAYATFQTPNLKLRNGYPAPQYAAAWVGIDGAECKRALLQAGVTTVVNSNGGQSSWAWWQWFPEASFEISTKSLAVKAGDWMSVNVTARSDTEGLLTVTNLSKGFRVDIEIKRGPPLCRIDSEWLIEQFYEADGPQVNLGQFDDIWFMDATSTTEKGNNIGVDGAAMVYLQDDRGELVCKAERYDDSTFYVYGP